MPGNSLQLLNNQLPESAGEHWERELLGRIDAGMASNDRGPAPARPGCGTIRPCRIIGTRIGRPVPWSSSGPGT